MTPHSLGPIMQLAYVVADLHEAVRAWSSKMSVGPFFPIEHMAFREVLFRGTPATPDISVAFAYSGDLQIELIQLHNDQPSVFRDCAASPDTGFHHVGILSTNLEADKTRLAAAGLQPLQLALSEAGVRTAMFFGGPMAGGIVELIEASPRLTGAFSLMKQAAENWDRASPYGRLPG